MSEVIDLSDGKGGIGLYCSSILAAYMSFPNCKLSRYQYLQIFRDEQEQYTCNKDGYQMSELTRILLNARAKSDGQRSVTALSFMAFAYLSSKGRPNSTAYAAQLLVEKSLAAAKEDGQPLLKADYEDGEWKIGGIRYPATTKEIRPAFQRYSSVGHILAGEMMCAEFFEIDLVFERTKEMDMTVLNAVFYLEAFLKHDQPALYQGLFRIQNSVPQGVLFSEEIPLGEKIKEFFDRGFD